jgi:hypothetical protein
MVKEMDAPGICCTCNSRWSCLSLSNSFKRGEPILYCESFDDPDATTSSYRKVKHDEFSLRPCFGIKDLIP